MNPTKLVQELVQSNLSKEVLKDYKFGLVSYNRIEKTDSQIFHHYEENKREIMDIDADNPDWDSWVYIHKHLSDKDEAGYINVIRFAGEKNHMKNYYIPVIDFAPDSQIEECDFSLLKEFSKNKLHVFNSGNSYHAVMNKLMLKTEYLKWLSVLTTIPFVDQKWLAFSIQNNYEDHTQVLRTTWTRKRPEPEYLKDINL